MVRIERRQRHQQRLYALGIPNLTLFIYVTYYIQHALASGHLARSSGIMQTHHHVTRVTIATMLDSCSTPYLLPVAPNASDIGSAVKCQEQHNNYVARRWSIVNCVQILIVARKGAEHVHFGAYRLYSLKSTI